MSVDILSIDRYPKIIWSSKDQQSHSGLADTFGLIGIRIGSKGLWIDDENLLIPQNVPSMANDLLIFGHQKQAAIWVYSHINNPFDLDDSERINQAGILAQDLLIADHEMSTAEKAIQRAKGLINSLYIIEIRADQETTKNREIIMEVVRSQTEKLSPDKLQKISKQLLDLGIEQIDATTPINDMTELRKSYWPNWLVRYSDPKQSIIGY